MTLRYLIDTDWAIHYLNGHPQIVQRLKILRNQGLGISVVSLAELYEGVYYSADPQGSEKGLVDLLGEVAIVGIDNETCGVFGKERGRLRAAGRMIGDFDLLIGATALQHSLTLLTNNRRHFEVIENLSLESV